MKKGFAKKKFAALIAVAAMIAAMAPATLAAEAIDINAVMETAFQKVVNDMLAAIGVVLPIALTVFGITMVIGFSIKFFRKVTNKAG